MFGWFKQRRRRKILSQPWPEEWSLHLNRNVRLSWGLSEQETTRLQQRIKVFNSEKHWEGVRGLELTEEIQVTISAQACLMLLGVEDYYFDNVHSIIVFPKAFQREHTAGGIVRETHHSGEAWQGGPIVLSWRDVLRGGRNEDDGHNLVVHEFAHALDGLDGEMGGNLMFQDSQDAKQWDRVVDAEYEELCQAQRQGYRTLLNHYGATNKAEFFAVVSETFFEQPFDLREQKNEMFQLLTNYYRVDPTNWQDRR